MSEEKPLHVRVAEALGWRDCKLCPDLHERPHWVGDAPVVDGWIRESHCMPQYDTDWAATGPLIEKYKLCILPHRGGWRAFRDDHGPSYGEGWVECREEWHEGTMEYLRGEGKTYLEAGCNLILKLAAAGKL